MYEVLQKINKIILSFYKVANFQKKEKTIAYGFVLKIGSEIVPNFYYIFYYIY